MGPGLADDAVGSDPTTSPSSTSTGIPATVSYGDHTGVIVSPYAAFVRQRIAQYMDDWQTQVPVDCMFLDQIGARPWLRDFNPASPSPTAYDDGWLAMLGTYSDRCLMVEDGWDRLARDSVGFHGGLLMMSRELDLPNAFFGAGNWQPYPLAVWLFHDKVLMYQHDLYDGTMATDGEVLTWNMAFGMINSYSWDALGPDANPWLDLVARLQRDFGPHYVGMRLSGYENLAPRRQREHVRRPVGDREQRCGAQLLRSPATTSHPRDSSPSPTICSPARSKAPSTAFPCRRECTT